MLYGTNVKKRVNDIYKLPNYPSV